MQYDWTRHIKIDKHFMKEKLDHRLMCMPTGSEVVDVLTNQKVKWQLSLSS